MASGEATLTFVAVASGEATPISERFNITLFLWIWIFDHFIESGK